jgi:hypothetical protein
MQFTYDLVTEAAARTIEMLTIQSHGSPSEENQKWWERAKGAVRMWEEVVGAAALPQDRERLQFLLEDMPGVDDEGEGNWHLTPVVRL